MNRVESWCQYLVDELVKYNYNITITTKTNWVVSDFPTYDEMERIRQNIRSIMNGYKFISTIYDVNSLNAWNYTYANRWEKILHEIENMLRGMEDYFVHSGVSNSGQNRMWQNRYRMRFIVLENLITDGKFNDLNNYLTNTTAKITKNDNYVLYEMTGEGTSGYVYNIYTKQSITLEQGRKYLYAIKWRNTQDYPTNNIGCWIRGSTTSGGSQSHITNQQFNSHGLDFDISYMNYTPSSTYYNVQLGIHSKNISNGASFEVEYQLLVDVTSLTDIEQDYLIRNIEKMVLFGNENGTYAMKLNSVRQIVEGDSLNIEK